MAVINPVDSFITEIKMLLQNHRDLPDVSQFDTNALLVSFDGEECYEVIIRRRGKDNALDTTHESSRTMHGLRADTHNGRLA